MNHKTVAIIQTRLHHFRVPFYDNLKPKLETANIDLHFVYGTPNEIEKTKNDEGHLDWGIKVENKRLLIGDVEFLWQPVLKYLKNADLVVVQQENRLLLNYLLLMRKPFTQQKLAFWGHGINCQSKTPNSLRERWKRLYIQKPDWWFAYTDFTKNILVDEGYDLHRITVVQNSIDTTELKEFSKTISSTDINKVKKVLGIGDGPVGIFCGSLYKEKRIDFLIAAASKIRQKVVDFHLVIIGAGPGVNIAVEATKKNDWIHFVGPKFGHAKVLHLMLGDVFLMPGLVGLSILDAFTLGLPLMTTDCRLHSPEIAYLVHSKNGLITSENIMDYADGVIRVLNDPDRLKKMKTQCKESAEKYSIENMSDNFADGIRKCLS
jgi:L-malate glycosyltransferase